MVQDFYEVRPFIKPASTSVQVPGSKSITNRALLLAALANGRSELKGTLVSEDAVHFLSCLEDLGFDVQKKEEGKTVLVRGMNGSIPNKSGKIYVGSAGTAARFLTAMLGLSDGVYEIDASEQMKKRPMQPLFDALRQTGAGIICLEEEGCLPVRIHGNNRHDSICRVDLDISRSTQFLSALLMTAPMLSVPLQIRITSEKKDGAYVQITRQMMQTFGVTVEQTKDGYLIPEGAGYTGRVYQIEPDISAACYFYAAAAVCKSSVTVKDVHPDLMQGDLKFLDVLGSMGCLTEDTPEGIRLTGPGQLKGISVNMNDFSDQALTLAAIAPYAESPVEIQGIAHIRGQECDRIAAMSSNLKRAGIRCEEWEDGIRIYPGMPHACEIETFQDHRVAMAFSLLGLRTAGIRILNPGCCAKTFPEYFETLEYFCG